MYTTSYHTFIPEVQTVMTNLVKLGSYKEGAVKNEGQAHTNCRGRARRLAILEAARTLFLERGFESTTLGDIVERSGGSLATLYALFGSKEGLFEAIAEEYAEPDAARVIDPEIESLPLPDALQRFGESYLKSILCPESVRWYRMCAAEGSKFPVLRETLARSVAGDVRERLTAYFSDQIEKGRLHMDDPVTAARQFFALVRSEDYFEAVCGKPVEQFKDDLQRQVRSAVDVFLYGYAKGTS